MDFRPPRQTAAYLADMLNLTSHHTRFLCILFCVGCLSHHRRPVTSERADVQRLLDRFHTYWLESAHLPVPPLDLTEQTIVDDGLAISVRFVQPEEASWNLYHGDKSRLFNDRAAWIFEVRAESSEPVRWLASETRLEINEEGNIRHPYFTPETLLSSLLEYARIQEKWAIDGDLHHRAGGAGEFRQSYIGLIAESPFEGVIAFERHPEELPIEAMRLTLGLEDSKGQHVVSWLFE
jgi:hypothetical protein